MPSRRRRSWKCCNGNTYLNFKSLTCHPCPAGSESKYGGLFCGTCLRELFGQEFQGCISRRALYTSVIKTIITINAVLTGQALRMHDNANML